MKCSSAECLSISHILTGGVTNDLFAEQTNGSWVSVNWFLAK